MGDSFLYSLIDTSGNVFQFGKEPALHRSVFLTPLNGDSLNFSVKYIQFYKGIELKPIHSQALLRKNVAPDWFFPLIIVVLAVITWVRIFYYKYFQQMVQAFLNNNLANQIVRDENIFIQRASVYLSIVFNLIAALLLYLLSVHYNWSVGGVGMGFSRFLFFLIIISAGYALKFLILKICGWLFEQEREMATYIFNVFLINNILGMTLLPFICILAYNETLAVSWFKMLPLVLVGLAFGWRLIRGIQIGMGVSSFSPLYLFLYLCTLEIAPLMILLRVVMQ